MWIGGISSAKIRPSRRPPAYGIPLDLLPGANTTQPRSQDDTEHPVFTAETHSHSPFEGSRDTRQRPPAYRSAFRSSPSRASAAHALCSGAAPFTCPMSPQVPLQPQQQVSGVRVLRVVAGEFPHHRVAHHLEL